MYDGQRDEDYDEDDNDDNDSQLLIAFVVKLSGQSRMRLSS